MSAPLDAVRWRQISEILEAARDVDATSLATWLDRVCGGDESLRAEVERLLAADRTHGPRLEAPPDRSTVLGDDPGEIAARAHGDQIGEYVIDQELARGGMGVVYRAWDTRLERWVALKALSPNLPADLQARERLKREAMAAARVTHESIATIYALPEVGDELFIVSEYVAGQSLRARLGGGRLPLRDAVETLLGIARGLAAAHALGVVHRDLKPENVMLTPAGRVKVVDFGIALVDGTAKGITRTGVLLGTPGYMAPEQVNGTGADARSDVFALGVVLYEMIAGRPPFGDGSLGTVIVSVLEREPQPLGEVIEGIPPALEQVVATCLAKSPAARYPNAEAVVFALEPVLADLTRGKTGPVRTSSVPVMAPGVIVPFSPRWWLQVHQLVATAAVALMMIPAWKLMSRLPRLPGRWLVLLLLVLAATLGTLRLYMVFAVRHHGDELADVAARLGRWLRWGNRAFALLLGAGGIAIADGSPELAAVCLACAAGTLVASEVIEPSTIERAIRAESRQNPFV